MKAILWEAYGPPEVLRLAEIDAPAAGDHEVLIKVHAANAFPGDCEMRAFKMHPSLWLPIRLMFGLFKPRVRILGQEICGVVVDTGKHVTRFSKGDEVLGTTEAKFGGYAEFVCLPETNPLTLKPAEISNEAAATLAVGGSNALHFLRLANLEPGERVLIFGACGSIGTYAVQLAKLAGAEVTAVDSADKLATLKSLGADHVIDYRQEDFTRSGIRYDVIFDVVGKSPYARSLESLAPGGRYLLANHGLTAMLRGLLTSLLTNKRVHSRLAATTVEGLDTLKGLMVDGKIRAVIDREFPLARAVDAHRYIESGSKTGHVVLKVR